MLWDTIIRPVKGDRPRKWMVDDFFDLIVWYEGETIWGFQLCYGKPFDPQALTWTKTEGAFHAEIDAGDDSPTANRTPILIPGGDFPRERIFSEFSRRSIMLPSEVRETVLEGIKDCDVRTDSSPSRKIVNRL